ncbi:MAG: hypothetical protein IJ712_06760 [Anaerovibrio sp.]|nr:hypothetical protein [Anaerovibrio sp.]
MNRVVVLISLFVAVLSAYGQQNAQWYDVSNFAPSVKQCKVSFTEDRLYVYVNTGDKDINFWVGEPQRTGALVVLDGNDLMEYRQGVFDEFITESLNSLPSNATIQSHTQQETKDYDIDPLENLEVEFQPVDKELLDEGLSNEEIADYYDNQRKRNQTENANKVISGVMQQSNGGQSQQQGTKETKQSNGSGLDAILENILMLVIGYWLLKALFKGLFSSSSSSKKSRKEKSSSERDYEDGPAWFHDHNQSI